MQHRTKITTGAPDPISASFFKPDRSVRVPGPDIERKRPVRKNCNARISGKRAGTRHHCSTPAPNF
eukprot:8826023-Pyramimonas_sp.AAC.1